MMNDKSTGNFTVSILLIVYRFYQQIRLWLQIIRAVCMINVNTFILTVCGNIETFDILKYQWLV